MIDSDALFTSLRSRIEEKIDEGYKRFAIFPFGKVGITAKNILNNAYKIDEEIIFDNHLCKYNSEIKELSCAGGGGKDLAVIFATTNGEIYSQLKMQLLQYFDEQQIVDIYSRYKSIKNVGYRPKCGKYSYGPMLYDDGVEEIGAFCSFAQGACVAPNHALDYITTHPIAYVGCPSGDLSNRTYEEYRNREWYLAGIRPRGTVRKLKRIHIGNDVWLGRNVIITNSADIGNGVIAAAGAVITKDVPDYAVVAGVPAKIIRYRYSPEQITELNKIAWWNWSDEEIRERFDDFYLPVDEFIKKYK